MIYIIYFNESEHTNYIFEGIRKDENITVLKYTYTCRGLLKKIVSRLLRKLEYYKLFLIFCSQKKFISTIKNIKSQDKVLFFNCYSIHHLYAFKKILPDNINCALWIWNPIAVIKSKIPSFNIDKIKSLGYCIYTFDLMDSEKFGVNFKNSVFCYPSDSDSNKCKYDFYFLGLGKGREQYLLSLEKYLAAKGFISKFLIISNNKDYISYKENINNILQTKCIVDITQEGQTGISLRVLEALFFSKKLITNFSKIKEMEFYTPQNIIFLKDIESINLEDFINQPVFEIDNRIKDNYDINTWTKSFFEL